jgi:hypothetical protein
VLSLVLELGLLALGQLSLVLVWEQLWELQLDPLDSILYQNLNLMLEFFFYKLKCISHQLIFDHIFW